MQSGRSDSNRRPPRPKRGALTWLRHAPQFNYNTSLAARTSIGINNDAIQALHFLILILIPENRVRVNSVKPPDAPPPVA